MQLSAKMGMPLKGKTQLLNELVNNSKLCNDRQKMKVRADRLIT